MLNCGLRIPPAAGSGSGANDNPLGTTACTCIAATSFRHERVVGRPRSGPRVRHQRPAAAADWSKAQPPGYVFHLDGSEPLTLEIGLNLATRVPVEYLQIIKNGEVEREVRLDELAETGGQAAAGRVRR